MKIFALGIVCAFSLFGNYVFAAPCVNMSLNLVPTNYYSTTAGSLTFGTRVQANTNNDGCNYFITFDYGSATTFSSRSLKLGGSGWPYQIAKDSSGMQILKQFPDVSSCSDVICDSLPAGDNNASKNNSYQFIIDSSNLWRAAGSYSENYTLRLYRGTPTSYQLVDQKTMNVTFAAAKRADISVVESGGQFDLADTTQLMNFGSGMTSGIQRQADIILKYNAGCNLYASSANNGSMKHTSQNQFVSYTFSLAGSTVSLTGSSSNPKLISNKSGVSPANGTILPVVVTTGSTVGKQPGTYTDTITLTVQTNQ